jgi:hypothetical protein
MLLGILRKNFTMGNIVVDQNIDIQYGIIPRQAGPTAECQITVTVKDLRTVSNRT